MATAAIPIIAASIPLLTPIVTGLVHQVEVLFGHKTGPTKFDVVLQSVMGVAGHLATAGTIPGQLDPASIAALIETVVQELKSKGVLNPQTSAAIISGQNVATVAPGSPAVQGAAGLKLTPGQSITISA